MNDKGLPSCIKATPKPFLETSPTNTKVLVKLCTDKIGVMHMAFFKVENACYATLFHPMALLFNWVVKQDAILP